ncbi:MAG: 2-isopropylmalate synthase [Planctomycetes bacterium]|nr:2-isopropylmalate synthase [Planctomycetota bacterium]
MTEAADLIYDWNTAGDDGWTKPPHPIEFDDESLRDGLQSPSVVTPTVDERIRILHLMDALGLDTADIGLPGAGGVVKRDTLELAQAMQRDRLLLAANCAARTVEADVRPILEIVEKTGRPIEACLFIGSSPIRRYAEDWTMDAMLEHTRRAVAFATKNGLDVMYVTEDTTRAHPDDIRRLYLTAIECGAKRICLCDTCGHATPHGVFRLIRHIRKLLADEKLTHVKVDFHGHHDRGLSVWNAIAALAAGANRVHGTALGIGERVGNAPMDQILVNLKLMGWIQNDLRKLYDYCTAVSRATQVPIPNGYPVVGKDAFETATGVHAAAVIKALKKGDRWLADRVYSGVPAGDYGREQVITIGPMSGKSNVAYWLEKRGRPVREDLVSAILEKAKQSNRVLTDSEIEAVIRAAAPTV